jgi:DNA uptake protein ComE-like DNA-binding protein
MKRSIWQVAAVAGILAIMAPLTASAQSGTTAQAKPAAAKTAAAKPAATTPVKMGHASGPKRAYKSPVDLNNSDRAQLMKLQGVTEKLADAIIAARPIKSGAELVSKKVLTQAEWTKIAKHVKIAPEKAASSMSTPESSTPKSGTP